MSNKEIAKIVAAVVSEINAPAKAKGGKAKAKAAPKEPASKVKRTPNADWAQANKAAKKGVFASTCPTCNVPPLTETTPHPKRPGVVIQRFECSRGDEPKHHSLNVVAGQ